VRDIHGDTAENSLNKEGNIYETVICTSMFLSLRICTVDKILV
jgi:hypothetical protein